MIDVDALVSPLGEGDPCGQNLEYDPDFMSLEAAARGKPDQEFGDTRIEAEEPDWKSIEEGALALLARTRDLRPTMLLVRALTRSEGVRGLAQGLELTARLVDELWEPLHPRLDPDDGNDPIMRINALSALVDEGGLLRDLRAARFVSVSGFAPCTVRQAEGALGLLDASEHSDGLSMVQIEGMVREAVGRGEVNHAQIALEQSRRLVAMLDERVGSDRSLDAKPLLARLAPLAALWAGATGDDGAQDASGEAAPGAGVGARSASAGELRSREDALRLLGKVCEFLERSEPTNPAPLLIRRAQRLMTMNFVDIMREMAPEGMDSVSKIAGLGSGGEQAES